MQQPTIHKNPTTESMGKTYIPGMVLVICVIDGAHVLVALSVLTNARPYMYHPNKSQHGNNHEHKHNKKSYFVVFFRYDDSNQNDDLKHQSDDSRYDVKHRSHRTTLTLVKISGANNKLGQRDRQTTHACQGEEDANRANVFLTTTHFLMQKSKQSAIVRKKATTAASLFEMFRH